MEFKIIKLTFRDLVSLQIYNLNYKFWLIFQIGTKTYNTGFDENATKSCNLLELFDSNEPSILSRKHIIDFK